ncbi:MAG: hypothetical protein ACFFD4_37710 [Candidatus Odinarchaeota archaeon]
MKKQNTKEPLPAKIAFCRDKEAVIAFAVPSRNNLTAKKIRELYRQRFTIETYYRMIHGFQLLSTPGSALHNRFHGHLAL